MDLTFERGTAQKPRGHALLYYRSSSNLDEIWATYLVILPVSVDVTKYVPPFLMNQMGELGPKDLSAFAFPPAPEKVADRATIEEMATRREDDIIYGGAINPTDVTSALMSVTEAVQQYATLCSDAAPDSTVPEVQADQFDEALNVNEVLYGLMSDADKLSELTTLIGRLRFAVDGGEEPLVREAEQDIEVLARHLPENHTVPRLVAAIKSTQPEASRLADLHLKRCFYLLQHEYQLLGQVEDEIRGLEGDGRA